MNKIFAGLIFLLVKINLNLFGIPIVIFPDFVAYIFIYFGLSELSVVTPLFRKSLKPAIFLIFYNIVTDLFALMPQVTYNGFSFSGIFKLISGLTTVYIFYIIILGLREYQKQTKAKIETYGLKKRWVAVSVMAVGSPLFRTLTYYDSAIFEQLKSGYAKKEIYYASIVYIVIAFIYGIISWCVLVYFTAEFNRVRAAYNMSHISK